MALNRRAHCRAAAAVLAALVLGLPACRRHDTIDLSQRADIAQRRWETHRIDLGTAEARPHLTAGWGIDGTWGNDSFTWALGTHSAVDFFIASPRPLKLRMRCWPLPFPDLPPQSVRVALNGTALGTLELEAQAAEYAVPVPAGALRPGINRLEFDYAYARRPLDVDPHSADQRLLSVAWDWIDFDGVEGVTPPAAMDGTGSALTLPLRSEISFYLDLPSGATLQVDGLERGGGGGAPAVLEVRAEGADGGDSRVEQWIVDGSGTGSQRVPLERSGVTKLTMRALPLSDGGEADGRIRVSAPRLTVPIAPGPDGALCSGVPSIPADPPPVVVYMIDTLRADHVGCYGYARPTTPRIDGFARDAVRFSNAIAQASWTRPSVASIFTGLTPRQHGVNSSLTVLPDLPTAASLLRAQGYDTAAFVTNTEVAPWTGLARGFNRYQLLEEQWVPTLGGPNMAEREIEHQGADVLRQQALAWLDTRTTTGPFFLYLHATDPHAPYRPNEAFRQRLAPDADPQLGTQSVIQSLMDGRREASDRDREMMEALYDADIAFVDHEFGALVDDLRVRGLYDRALIVVVADHGEAFGAHGQWQHSTTLFDELIRIPLLVKFPAQWKGGTVADGVAQQVDILPTILRALGIDAPAGLAGQSLLPAVACPGAARTNTPAYSYIADPETESVVVGDRKLIHYLQPDSPHRRFELYDRSTDAEERRDLAARNPVEVGYLSTVMAAFTNSRPAVAAVPTQVLDASTQERLRALGYAH